MISDNEATRIIAQAIINEELVGLTNEELDEVATFHYWDDPNVELINLDYTQEAGPDLHGVNTEEEKLSTWDGE